MGRAAGDRGGPADDNGRHRPVRARVAEIVAACTIPKVLLQEIVGYYSRTPEKPAGINLDDPFALPARIREIQVGPARQAMIVQ